MPEIELWHDLDETNLQAELPPDISIRRSGALITLSPDGFSLPIFIVTWAGSVSAAVVARALYDAILKKSRKKTEKTTIEGRQIDLKEGEIKRAIEVKITIEKKEDIYPNYWSVR
jgi:hypothetical protein